MNIKKEDVETFLYEGNDNMIDFENKKIPKPRSDFVAQLRLKNGKLVTAPSIWREDIWKWWYTVRKGEIESSVLVRAARSLVGKYPSYESDFVEITRDGKRVPASRKEIEKLRKYLEEK